MLLGCVMQLLLSMANQTFSAESLFSYTMSSQGCHQTCDAATCRSLYSRHDRGLGFHGSTSCRASAPPQQDVSCRPIECLSPSTLSIISICDDLYCSFFLIALPLASSDVDSPYQRAMGWRPQKSQDASFHTSRQMRRNRRTDHKTQLLQHSLSPHPSRFWASTQTSWATTP